MNIKTKFFGSVEIKEEEILTFEEGILGFPDIRKFVLLPLDTDLPLVVLQSIEQQELGFVIAYPFAFKKDYSFDLGNEEKTALGVEQEEEVVTYTIVTLKETFNESTTNLLAPLVINMKKKLGKQIVLQDNSKYSLRHPISVVEGSAE